MMWKRQKKQEALKKAEEAKAAQEKTDFEKTFNRKLRDGQPEWNVGEYNKFRSSLNIPFGLVPAQHNPKVIARRAIFDKAKPLGRDELHYRGEIYRDSNMEKFLELNNLKAGDIYEPRINFWFSDSSKYAHGRYGSPGIKDWKGVHYTILCPSEAKVVQTTYGEYGGHIATEGIYSDIAKFKVLAKENKDNILNITLEYLV